MQSEALAPLVDVRDSENEKKVALRHAVRQVRMRALTVTANGDVPSPCISICRMNESSGWCEGCFRTRDEIAGWSSAGDNGKRRLWKIIEQRMESLQT